MATFFADYDGVLCDLDGVVYAGSQPIDTAITTLNTLMAQGVPVAFITNNASKSAVEVAERLGTMGLYTDPEHVMTSAHAVVELLSTKYDHTAGPVLVTGSTQLIKQVQAAGFTVTAAAADSPQVVVQGFNPNLRWDDLAQASFALQNGAGWLASNLDLTIPLAAGMAPGNGAMVQAVSQATGTRPEVAAGKPAPVMFETMAKLFAMNHPLVVGDRLDTDILGASNAGYHAALVETGIHSRSDVPEFHELVTPDWVLPNLKILLDQPLEVYRGQDEPF